MRWFSHRRSPSPPSSHAMVSSVAVCCVRPSYGARPTMHCQWGWLGSFSFFVPREIFVQCTTAKFDHPTISRSEVIVRTNKHIDKLTNKQTPLKTPTSLRYTTPVDNENVTHASETTWIWSSKTFTDHHIQNIKEFLQTNSAAHTCWPRPVVNIMYRGRRNPVTNNDDFTSEYNLSVESSTEAWAQTIVENRKRGVQKYVCSRNRVRIRLSDPDSQWIWTQSESDSH